MKLQEKLSKLHLLKDELGKKISEKEITDHRYYVDSIDLNAKIQIIEELLQEEKGKMRGYREGASEMTSTEHDGLKMYVNTDKMKCWLDIDGSVIDLSSKSIGQIEQLQKILSIE